MCTSQTRSYRSPGRVTYDMGHQRCNWGTRQTRHRRTTGISRLSPREANCLVSWRVQLLLRGRVPPEGTRPCHLRARGRKRRWSSGNSASKPWRKLLDGGTGNPPGAPDNVRTSARQRKSSAEARLIGNFGQRCAFTSRGQAPFARSFLFDPQTM